MNIIETVEDVFETTKRGIREILQSDMMENVAKYIFKVGDTEHEFGMEQEDINEMLPIIQAINLGVLDEVTVKDKEGNELTLTAEEYIQRNNEGFKKRAKEEVDLTFLNSILDEIETFTEFVYFGSLEMAKEHFITEPEIEEEVVEEEIIEEPIEVEEE